MCMYYCIASSVDQRYLTIEGRRSIACFVHKECRPTELRLTVKDEVLCVEEKTKCRAHKKEEQVLIVSKHGQICAEDTCGPADIVTQLKACAKHKDLHGGSRLHAELARKGLVQRDMFVASILINLYAKCNALAKAVEVFDELSVRNVVLWTTLIAGYTQHGYGEEALACFKRLLHEGVYPDAFTFACILKACGSIPAAENGQQVHMQIVKEGLLDKNVIVANALLDMYVKCALLEKAEEVFDELPVRNVVSWNTLLTGYVQHGLGEQALSCFEQMQLGGLSVDDVTFICVLKACSSIGAVHKGQEVHDKVVTDGFSDDNIIVGTSLVDMYASCSMLAEAQEVFDKLSVRDVASWNALIAGYALLGKDKVVFDSLDQMIAEGREPNLVTFIIVLNTCSYRGLIDACRMYFEVMSTGYSIISTLEHYTCMFDLFCRAGQLDEAVVLIREMPFCADLTVWQTVLDACQKWGNMKIGGWAFKHAVQLDERDPAAYVSISNM